MMRVLIVTGGNIDLPFTKEYVEKHLFDFIIAADSGLNYCQALGCKVDLILGDFDSVDASILADYKQTKTKIFPPEKDYTDTHLALLTAIAKGATDITIIGATGGRLDHTMANVGLIKIPYERGQIPCRIVDSKNRIQILGNYTEIHKSNQWGDYISLLPYTERVSNIVLKGFKYPLENATLNQGESIGISNELILEHGSISFTDGILLMIEARD